MPSYATPQELVERFDLRTVGQLVTDDQQQLSHTAVVAHQNVLTALQDASGRVESALLHGGRYKVTDLTSLSDNSQNYLKLIVCTLAMVSLLRRRPGCFTELLSQLTAEAEEHIKQLKSGSEVFNLDAHKGAGVLEDSGHGNLDSISLLNNRSLISDVLTHRLFPARDTGRQGSHRGFFAG